VGFARVKNKKSIWRAKPQSRQGLRKSNQSDHNFFASLRLCETKKEKKNKSRKAAKPPRPPEVKPIRLQILCVSAPLREEKNKSPRNAAIIPTQFHQEAMGTDGYF
jgi:hypothetical protein